MRSYVIPHIILLLYTTHTICIKIGFLNTKTMLYNICNSLLFTELILMHPVFKLLYYKNFKAIYKIYKLPFLKKVMDLMFLVLTHYSCQIYQTLQF